MRAQSRFFSPGYPLSFPVGCNHRDSCSSHLAFPLFPSLSCFLAFAIRNNWMSRCRGSSSQMSQSKRDDLRFSSWRYATYVNYCCDIAAGIAVSPHFQFYLREAPSLRRLWPNPRRTVKYGYINSTRILAVGKGVAVIFVQRTRFIRLHTADLVRHASVAWHGGHGFAAPAALLAGCLTGGI